MSDATPESMAAYLSLLDTLRAASDGYLRNVETELDRAEGLRYLLHVLAGGIDLYLEGDAERPVFTPMVSSTRKWGGDNPDALYHFARIRGDRSYRITGRKGRECYLSFTVHGRPNPDRLGLIAEPVQADINDRQLAIGPDGRFEIVLSPTEHDGDWIKLQPTAASVIVRHYYELETSAACDPSIRPELRIEPLDPVAQRPVASGEQLARRIRDVAAFVRGSSLELVPMGALPVPFVSKIPNELPLPSAFKASGQASWGAVDIAYSMAPFAVGPDEALVIEGALPPCAFANVVLWNRHMQTFEYRDRRVSLNRAQMKLGEGRSYRVVIAHEDPGEPNWLDPAGHVTGQMFWRFLLPEAQPERPACRLVKLASLTER
jgi:hypothetical protein